MKLNIDNEPDYYGFIREWINVGIEGFNEALEALENNDPVKFLTCLDLSEASVKLAIKIYERNQ